MSRPVSRPVTTFRSHDWTGPEPLGINHHATPDAVVVSVRGEIDMLSSAELWTAAHGDFSRRRNDEPPAGA